MKKELWRGVLALAVLSLPALAKTGVSFSHKDWEVVCDNTLTCRAAGYSALNQNSMQISDAGSSQ